ncbi:MAG: S-methyl-5-thioribose-1-phosphate isomerase [Candidatus Asgardarchaeia archaeon]
MVFDYSYIRWRLYELIRTIRFEENKVVMIDQNLLPTELKELECRTYKEVAEAIRTMKIRGAPAIGVAAAMGIALAAINSKAKSKEELLNDVKKAADELRSTRPTAVNLFWAIERMLKCVDVEESIEGIKERLLKEALKMAEEDVDTNMKIGEFGKNLIEDGDRILTHCNAGSLATVYYGTALGVIRAAFEEGKKIEVFADETRPKLQGARLTAFELSYDGIPVTVITDNMAGYLMSKGMIDKVIVGADRILRTGHVINKIGTYSLAILAKYHGIPFYVAAPTSTFDLKSELKDVIIEERDPREVTHINGVRIVPEGVKVMNPAFDITPPELLSAIITEKGILKKPYEKSIGGLFSSDQSFLL